MSKKLRTDDELIPERGSGIAPENTFPSAANEVGVNATRGARQDTGESTFPFPGRDVEYRAPASRLPMTMTQAESKKWNCDFQAQTPWDSETENAPILAGTRSGTPSATPVADDLPGQATGRAIAEGDPESVVSNIAEGASNVVQGLGSMAALAIADGKGKPEGNSVEDAFSRLRRLGGGR